MPTLSYRRPGLTIARGGVGATEQQIRELQRDLRQLGYLRAAIDGDFGGGTERAVQALRHDLLSNDGKGPDGKAPVRVRDYNKGRVTEVNGVVDQKFVAAMADILDDGKFPKLVFADDPEGENRKVVEQIAAIPKPDAPIPFLLAVLKQESNLRHYREPGIRDEDTYITIGLDTNNADRHIITSRGYGAGQYTLFHHPPTKKEVKDFMLDPRKNVLKAIEELKNKFDKFVNGSTSGTRADDRIAEIGKGALVTCKYKSNDPRFLKDCKQCLIDAGDTDIKMDVTPYYKGSKGIYKMTQYYKKPEYTDVPIRKNIGCDWPYAIRRYNGSGVNSYHYQTRILQHMEAMPNLVQIASGGMDV